MKKNKKLQSENKKKSNSNFQNTDSTPNKTPSVDDIHFNKKSIK